MQTAIVIVLVTLALLYLVYRKLGNAKGERPSCGCGCSECGTPSCCGDSNPYVTRAKVPLAKDR